MLSIEVPIMEFPKLVCLDCGHKREKHGEDKCLAVHAGRGWVKYCDCKGYRE